LPVIDVPADSLRRGSDRFGGQGGGLFGRSTSSISI